MSHLCDLSNIFSLSPSLSLFTGPEARQRDARLAKKNKTRSNKTAFYLVESVRSHIQMNTRSIIKQKDLPSDGTTKRNRNAAKYIFHLGKRVLWSKSLRFFHYFHPRHVIKSSRKHFRNKTETLSTYVFCLGVIQIWRMKWRRVLHF